MVESLRVIGSVLIVLSALLAVACLAAQMLLARWWRTPGGRHFFWFHLVLALCLGLWALRLVFPDGNWFQIARLIAFAGIPVVLAWRLQIIIHTWRKGRRQRTEAKL